MEGRFITFEGIDGSGKTTALGAVHEGLASQGTKVWATREETDTWLGETVRRSITEGASPWTTAFLFLADRASHVPAIEARLGSGHVLCDRFQESTYAYQGATLGWDAVDALRAAHESWCLRADHVLLFDLPVEVAIARAEARGATTPYEKQAFLEKVRANYLRLAAAEPDRFTVIDASRSADAVAAEALRVVEGLVDAAQA